jgi:hypothetical protein
MQLVVVLEVFYYRVGLGSKYTIFYSIIRQAVEGAAI